MAESFSFLVLILGPTKRGATNENENENDDDDDDSDFRLGRAAADLDLHSPRQLQSPD